MTNLNELQTIVQSKKRFIDGYSKIILSFKPIQAYLLQQCLDEFKNLSLKEISALIQPSSSNSKIITLNTEDIRIPGAKIVYDLLYVVKHPLYPSKFMLIHIEAQGEESYKYALPCRSLYYAYRLIAGQKNHSLGFQKSFYNDILDVRSFWICLHHAKKKDNCLLEYVTHENQKMGNFCFDSKFYGMSKTHLLYPSLHSKEEQTLEEILNGPKSIMELLSILFLSDRDHDQIIQILERKYDILLSDEDKEEIKDMCTFGQGAYLAWTEHGMKQGRKEGRKQGRIEGHKSGELDNLVQNISLLLKSGTISDIQQAFSILRVKKEMQSKVLKRLNLH